MTEQLQEPEAGPGGPARRHWTYWAEKILGPVPDLPGPRGLSVDQRAALVLWTSAVILVLLVFRAGFPTPGHLYSGWSDVNPDGLTANVWSASWGYLFYILVPFAIIIFVLKESPANYGFRVYITKKTALLYATLILAMMPLLFWASTRSDFQRTYPFVKDFGDAWVWSLLVWETVRATRFLCLEFFFRGYLLFGLEAKLGYSAIAVSTIPYGLIHFAKPFPEAMGAICAGAVLGFIALRTRTVVGGAIIHASIAVSMDMLALWRVGFF